MPGNCESRPQCTGEIASELAVHFEAGRDTWRAVRYLRQAGDSAVRRHAHQEAIEHLTRGLALLKTLPDTPEHAHQELLLQTNLGPAFMATKGYAAPEVERVYARVRELCRYLGETPQLFSVIGGLWVFYNTRAQLQTARELAEQSLTLAQRIQRPAAFLWAYMWLGETLFYQGDIRAGREHLEQSIQIYDPHKHSPRVSLSPHDPGEGCLAYLAWCLWLLGYPNQALEKSQEACALAREVSHPFSLAHALSLAAWVHQARGEPRIVQERAEAVITLSDDQGSAYRRAQGTILQGWALVEQGDGEKGIAQIHQGLAAWRTTGAEGVMPYYLALLAEAHGKAGHVEEGLNVVIEALELVHRTGERWYEAELYRLKGELALQKFQVSSFKFPTPYTLHPTLNTQHPGGGGGVFPEGH